jgi:hypothetical protein
MGALERVGSKLRVPLLPRHLIGRGALAHLRLADPGISAEHALVAWTGRRWEVHDLGSKNGTTVGGRRLQSGERAALEAGEVVAFGGAGPAFRLVDDRPPTVMALPVEGGEPIVGEHDMLVLPSAEQPEITVFRDAVLVWVIERDGGVERVAGGTTVEAGGGRYVLHLPDAVPTTVDDGERPLLLDGALLAFRVSRDEEFVALSLREGQRTVDLGARAHHAVLLALARARLRDEAVPESSRGWMYQDDLARGLGLAEGHLHVLVHRIRQQLAAAGVLGAAAIIERRQTTRQIRCGVPRVEIEET